MKLLSVNFKSPVVYLVIFLAILGTGFGSLGYINYTKADNTGDNSDETAVNLIAEPEPVPEPVTCRATIAAVGDLLIHTPINSAALIPETGAYDYSPIFKPVQPWLAWADYTIANLETRMAGEEHGYSGYPQFNTPDYFANSLAFCGFDLMAMANNHSMDMGVDGIFATIEKVRGVGLDTTGNYLDSTEHVWLFFKEINGINIAFLNYTEMTNGIPVPETQSFACNMLDVDTVINEASIAHAQGADFVVAILHFGDEYQRDQNSRQEDIVERICAGGVDIVIGSHPHVVQPIERITVDRNGIETECVVAYSLGNFISNQRDRYTDCGIILYLTLEKTDEFSRVIDIEYLPVWVQKALSGGGYNYRILPVHPDIDIESDIEVSETDQIRLDQVWDEIYTQLENTEDSVHAWDGKLTETSTEQNWYF